VVATDILTVWDLLETGRIEAIECGAERHLCCYGYRSICRYYDSILSDEKITVEFLI
jgi:hypothetical protein